MWSKMGRFKWAFLVYESITRILFVIAFFLSVVLLWNVASVLVYPHTTLVGIWRKDTKPRGR
jgi:hypothetical protein